MKNVTVIRYISWIILVWHVWQLSSGIEADREIVGLAGGSKLDDLSIIVDS